MLSRTNEVVVSRRYVLVVGSQGSGKTTFINANAPSPFPAVATTQIEVSQPIPGKSVVLVEGPGFGIDSQNNNAIHQKVAKWVAQITNGSEEIFAVIFVLSV